MTVQPVSAATPTTRRLVLALAALLYAGIFVAFVFVESPGLGLGNFFYVPLCLVALVTDEAIGAVAGVLATGLYVAGVVLAPAVPSAQAVTSATAIRLVTFTIVGALMGFYASRNRELVDRLRDLAGRDFVTGLGNARIFDEELGKRCAAGESFALVLADADGLNELNQVHGHAAGNAALRRIGEVLTQHADPRDVLARIGGDEFALLTSLPPDQIAALQARANRTLASENLSATFGVTFCPDDGQTSSELFHKADDRLFAAKLVRQNRATVVALADRSA
jgi:diguanylate cyclase (GGDEF)-like protein